MTTYKFNKGLKMINIFWHVKQIHIKQNEDVHIVIPFEERHFNDGVPIYIKFTTIYKDLTEGCFPT